MAHGHVHVGGAEVAAPSVPPLGSASSLGRCLPLLPTSHLYRGVAGCPAPLKGVSRGFTRPINHLPAICRPSWTLRVTRPTYRGYSSAARMSGGRRAKPAKPRSAETDWRLLTAFALLYGVLVSVSKLREAAGATSLLPPPRRRSCPPSATAGTPPPPHLPAPGFQRPTCRSMR